MKFFYIAASVLLCLSYSYAEDEAAILSLTHKEYLLLNELVVYEKGSLFLPLDQSLRALGYVPTITEDTYVFYNSVTKDTVKMNTIKKTVAINDKAPVDIQPLFENFENKIYISEIFLKTFLKVELSYNKKESKLEVMTNDIPAIGSIVLENKRATTATERTEGFKYKNEYKNTDYISFPVFDFDNGFTSSNSGSTSFNRVSGSMDLLGADFIFHGNLSDTKPKVYSWALGRSDENGFFHTPVKDVNFGNLVSPRIDLIKNTSMEQGLFLSTIKRGYFSHRSMISGNSAPGNIVELYRNGYLVTYAKVEKDAKYVFDKLLLYPGKNVFKIKTYYPDGRTQEEMKVLFSTRQDLERNNFSGEVIVSDNKNLPSDISKANIIADVTYGVNASSNLTFTFTKNKISAQEQSFSSYVTAMPTNIIVFPDFLKNNYDPLTASPQRNYYSLSYRTSIFNSFLETDLALDENKGKASKLYLSSFFNNFTMEYRTFYFDRFTSQFSYFDNDFLRTRNNVRLLLAKPRSNYNFESEYQFTVDEGILNKQRRLHYLRNSISFFKTSVTNYLERREDNYSTDKRRLRGDLVLSYRPHYQYTLTNQATYSETNRFELNEIKSYIDYLKNDNSRFALGLIRSILAKTNTLFSSWSQRWTHFNSNIQLGSDFRKNYSAAFNLSFSFGKIPETNDYFFTNRSLTSSGLISPRVIDEDGKELSSKDLNFIANNSSAQRVGVSSKKALINNLTPYHKIDLGLNPSSFADSDYSVEDGLLVTPRPGIILTPKFKIFRNREIEGFIKTSKLIELWKIFVLKDDKKVYETFVSKDGYFYMKNIKSGKYKIQVVDETNTVLAETETDTDSPEAINFEI